MFYLVLNLLDGAFDRYYVGCFASVWGKCDHISTYFCAELASDIVRNTYVKFHSLSSPINTVIKKLFTCQQILF